MPRSSRKTRTSRSSSEPEYVFDEVKAKRWRMWFERLLTHHTGHLQGTPIILMPFWLGVIETVFGTLRRSDRLRRYDTVFIYIPRGNAKTTVMAGVALGAITIDDEPGAEVYLQASTAEEAAYMFEICKGFVERNEDLAALYSFGVDEDDHEFIMHLASRSTLRFMSGKPKGVGKNPHMVFIDEYQKQKDMRVETSWKFGFQKRRQPILFLFGTAGEGDEESGAPWLTTLRMARRIAKNPDSQPNFLSVVYETTEEDDPHAEATWKKANPGWGHSINPAQFRNNYLTAVNHDDPQVYRDFLQYNLNYIVPGASQYLNIERWDQCKAELKLEEFAGQECFGGLDFSQSDDMTAFSLIFPRWEKETREVKLGDVVQKELVLVPYLAVFTWFFSPRVRIEKTDKEETKYRPWVEQGFLEECGEETIDYAYVRARVKAVCAPFKVKEIGVDPYHAGETTTNMAATDKLTIVIVNQTMRALSQPTKRLKEMALNHQISHNGHPVLRWNLKNAHVISDHKKNVMLTKKIVRGKKVSTAKIDGLASVVNAVRCWMDQEPPRLSVYETRGLA